MLGILQYYTQHSIISSNSAIFYFSRTAVLITFELPRSYLSIPTHNLLLRISQTSNEQNRKKATNNAFPSIELLVNDRFSNHGRVEKSSNNVIVSTRHWLKVFHRKFCISINVNGFPLTTRRVIMSAFNQLFVLENI